MYSLIFARAIKPILFNRTSNKSKKNFCSNKDTTILCNFEVFLLGTF